MIGFEGSYLGSSQKISAQAIMECKICWTPYDPAEGDETRQIDPGTPFLALPEDWSCPNCSAPKEQFLVQDDPGSDAEEEARIINSRIKPLVDDFNEVWHGKMRDVPIVNKLLRIEAVGFRLVDGRPLGVLISPWFMNLIQLPAQGEDWSDLLIGRKEIIAFPSGDYEFISNTRPMIGGYKACSLFSPMNEFRTQAQAVEVARAVMSALFSEEHRAETDRSADIRAKRLSELEAEALRKEGQASAAAGAQNGEPVRPTRRQLLTGGLAEDNDKRADEAPPENAVAESAKG